MSRDLSGGGRRAQRDTGEGPRVSRESLGYGNSSRSDTGGEGFLDGTDDERGQGEGAAVL